MRRMLTSRQIEILDSMTEEVFESGVWEIPSGTTNGTKNLKSLVVGYQYKIYLNVKTSTSNDVVRLETELGLSQDYFNFFDSGNYSSFTVGNRGGGTLFRLVLTRSTNFFSTILRFDGTLTEDVEYRYLITRHKLYI